MTSLYYLSSDDETADDLDIDLTLTLPLENSLTNDNDQKRVTFLEKLEEEEEERGEGVEGVEVERHEEQTHDYASSDDSIIDFKLLKEPEIVEQIKDAIKTKTDILTPLYRLRYHLKFFTYNKKEIEDLKLKVLENVNDPNVNDLIENFFK